MICARIAFTGAKASPEILPNPYYASRRQMIGRRFDPRTPAFNPTTNARKRFNTHRARSGSVQRILSAMLRHRFSSNPEASSRRSTTDRILDDIVPLTSRLLCDTIRP